VVARARTVSTAAWILGALIVLAAAIRIVTIDNQSFWADEALTAYEAGLPFGTMLHTVARFETTPPLYFVVVWGWARLFGTANIALRSVSAIAGVALVPIAYLCARELVSRRAGVLAAAFVAVNPFMIWYSQEARSYMLLATLSGASFLWFLRSRRDPSRQHLLWWAVFSAAAVMTHFFAGFLVAPEAAWLLWRSRTRATAITVAVVAAAQVAMLPFAVSDTSHGAGWIAAIPRLNRIATTVIEWGASNLYRRATNVEGLAGGLTLAVIVALLLLRSGDSSSRRGAEVATVIAGFVFLAPLALAVAGQDYFLSRNEIPAFVPLVTVLAAACVAPRAGLGGAVLAAVLLALFCVTAIDVQTHPYLQRPDWRAVAHSLGPAVAPRAILAADGTTADPLKIYLPGVSWIAPEARRVKISEVDIIGATKRLPLQQPAVAPSSAVTRRAGLGSKPRRGKLGSTVPRSVAPPGARLLARFRVDNWVVARFALVRPELLSGEDLERIAPRFFRRTPAGLLIFTQPRAR
jgi:mannosyltransferase